MKEKFIRDCWCGNAELEWFSDFYCKCNTCYTLISQAEINDSIYDVQNEESDLYGEKYWIDGMARTVAGVDTIEELMDLYFTYRVIHWIKYIFQYSLPPAKVLEVGCGLGQLPYIMKQIGYEQKAYELSPNIVMYCKELLNINIECGDFSDTNEVYDLIISIDVIEHLLEPINFIKKVKSKLTPNGVLCLQTPIYNPSLSYDDLINEKPFWLKLLAPDGHIFIFSKISIEKLLNSHDFKNIEYEIAAFGNDDHDMFLFASQMPIRKYDSKTVSDALKNQSNGWIYRALIKLYDEKREQISSLNKLESKFQTVQKENKVNTEIYTKNKGEQNLLNNFFKKKINHLITPITNNINESRNIIFQQIESTQNDIKELKEILNNPLSNVEKASINNLNLYLDAITTNRILADKIASGEQIDYERILKLHYLKFIKSGDTVIDIGAYTGRHLSTFIDIVGKDGKVIAIEPLENQYNNLYRRFKSNNVKIFNVALSNISGEMVFYKNKKYLEESGLKKRIYTHQDGEIIELKMNVTTLDILLDVNEINYIKINAAGAEVDIINGGLTSINKYRPIISVEYGYQSYSVYGLTKTSLFELAKSINYLVADIYGNIIYTLGIWELLCDSLYWDYFLVPEEKLGSFMQTMHS